MWTDKVSTTFSPFYFFSYNKYGKKQSIKESIYCEHWFILNRFILEVDFSFHGMCDYSTNYINEL